MKIPFCEGCGRKNTEGVVCSHCDTMYCYDCMERNGVNVTICHSCGKYMCAACRKGMDFCSISKKTDK